MESTLLGPRDGEKKRDWLPRRNVVFDYFYKGRWTLAAKTAEGKEGFRIWTDNIAR